MDHVIVNPSWYVPPSILKKEFLPGLAADPDYAAKRGYVVTRRGSSISVRQPPGERNALGWIKFMFPNDHAVYLHDTPNRRLFATERRAYSHGCVRVDNPFQLADQVLGPEWTQERLKRLIGTGERRINLPQPMRDPPRLQHSCRRRRRPADDLRRPLRLPPPRPPGLGTAQLKSWPCRGGHGFAMIHALAGSDRENHGAAMTGLLTSC